MISDQSKIVLIYGLKLDYSFVWNLLGYVLNNLDDYHNQKKLKKTLKKTLFDSYVIEMERSIFKTGNDNVIDITKLEITKFLKKSINSLMW